MNFAGGRDTTCANDSLETARKQLPKGSSGVVFLGIPETWTALVTNQDLVNAGLARLYRGKTTRVAAVVVAWSETVLSPQGGVIVMRFWTKRNDRVVLPAETEHLLQTFAIAPSAPWTDLRSTVVG